MFRKESPSSFVEKKELLGMGSFGAVYKGVLVNPTDTIQDEVAVKIISYNGDELNQLGRELYFLKNLSSPFIVKYVDSFISKGELWIVMELCDSGSLLDLCQATNVGLSEPELKGVMACSILGLVHIHERRSIHRVSDVK
jgi:serine/threonine protein kinase